MKRKKINKRSAKQKKKDAIHATIREICLIRHPYCVICGISGGVLQGGHLIPKARSESVRYDLMNVFTSCQGCNWRHTKNQHPMIEWFIREYGEEEYLSLVEKSRLIIKDRMWELEATHDDLKQVLFDLKKSREAR